MWRGQGYLVVSEEPGFSNIPSQISTYINALRCENLRRQTQSQSLASTKINS